MTLIEYQLADWMVWICQSMTSVIQFPCMLHHLQLTLGICSLHLARTRHLHQLFTWPN